MPSARAVFDKAAGGAYRGRTMTDLVKILILSAGLLLLYAVVLASSPTEGPYIISPFCGTLIYRSHP